MRLLLALLPIIWSWDPVTLDCKGGPELLLPITYTVAQVLVEPAGFRTDCNRDEMGQEVCVVNIVYHPAVFLGEDLVDEPRYPDDAVYVPAPGGVTFWEPGAVDAAGNRSGEPCL